MLPRPVRRLVAGLAAATLVGCGGTDPNLSLLTIQLSALETGRPVIDWPQQGLMTSVQITTQADQTAILWRVETPGEDGLAGPITYGDPGPAGARVTGTAPTLSRGVEYRVSIRNAIGVGGSGRFRVP